MRLKSIITENDFVAYAPLLTKVAEAITIPNDSYAWNNTLKAIHVNDASASKFGGFRLSIGFLKVGDVVTVHCEVMNVSGVKAKLAFDYNTTNVNGSGEGTYNLYSSTNDGGSFETIDFTYIITKDAYYSIPFGIFTGDIGEYYIRNCWVECDTKYSQEPKNYKNGFRNYHIQFAYGDFLIPDYHTFDKATIVEDSANKKLILTHARPFAAKIGLPFIQSEVDSKAYRFRVSNIAANGCDIIIYDRTTDAPIDPTTLSGTFWFSVMFSGFDNVNVAI